MKALLAFSVSVAAFLLVTITVADVFAHFSLVRTKRKPSKMFPYCDLYYWCKDLCYWGKWLGLFVLLMALAGCSPLRGYKFATHGPGDTSAGDLTHADEPGARVVIPKKQGPFYIRAFDRPHPDCVEVDHHVGDKLKTWACATK